MMTFVKIYCTTSDSISIFKRVMTLLFFEKGLDDAPRLDYRQKRLER